MIEVKKDEQGVARVRLEGTLPEVTAQCILVMREIYKRNLAVFAEPEIATGILTNMAVKALDIGGLNKKIEELRERMQNEKEKDSGNRAQTQADPEE